MSLAWSQLPLLACRLTLILGLATAFLQAQERSIEALYQETQPGEMITNVGTVTYRHAVQPELSATNRQTLGIGDMLRTHPLARAWVRFDEDRKSLFLRSVSRLEVIPATNGLRTTGIGATNQQAAIRLEYGEAYYRSGGGPVRLPVTTPHATAELLGTEFLIRVDPVAGTSDFVMFDGEVELSNGVDTRRVTRGLMGTAAPGQPIRIQSILKARNSIVQWWIYYPAILDFGELNLTPAEETSLAASLAAYRSGHLLRALELHPGYPNPPAPATDSTRIYLAALQLAIGAVDDAQAQLARLTETNLPTARALHTMIQAVTPPLPGESTTAPAAPERARRDLPSPVAEADAPARNPTVTARPSTSLGTASEWLALSYAHQSNKNLEEALKAARAATDHAPSSTFNSHNSKPETRSPKPSHGSGFAWARVAELEFSFGHTRAARIAVERALTLTPSNAQAHSLHGYLLAADHRLGAALAAFDRAIVLDPLLGNAWLGRGLAQRRRSYRLFGFDLAAPEISKPSPLNSRPSWLSDIRTAALLEPSRSLLRSYLGKAFHEVGLSEEAYKEFSVAKHYDTNDPTPWLYSALLNREENRINASVRDLDRSIALNTNRAVYRSSFLLDEDRAVRSTSLARTHQDAGMNEVAFREAARAVAYDYANYSAHLFLSDSYYSFRDPTRFNLRYETPWLNEWLLASLLSPVGGTPLSQHVSQQEYSRLFDQNRVGLTTDTSYRSDGQFLELSSQFGNLGNTAWSLDLDYQHNEGVRPNNELDRIEWYSTVKQQLTYQDSVMLIAKYQDYHSGDNFQYRDPSAEARPAYTFDENEGVVLGAYHREWAPGSHTLFLGGWLSSDQQFSDTQVPFPVVYRETADLISNFINHSPRARLDVEHRIEFNGYTAELQQIQQSERNTLIFGARGQTGNFTTHSHLGNLTSGFPTDKWEFVPSVHQIDEFQRLSGYAYYTLQPWPELALTGGAAYDYLTTPRNFRAPPISGGEETLEQLSPKGALVWAPIPEATFRGLYSRSLGGASLEESYRLEPTQLAGFGQTYRTVIPESVVGSVAAPEIETWGASVDLKFKSGTYVSIEGQSLQSDVDQAIGVFDRQLYFSPANGRIVSSSATEKLRYDEWSAAASIHQLLGEYWSLAAQYRFIHSQLDDLFPDIPSDIPARQTHRESDIHRVSARVLFNHPSGIYGLAESIWYAQDSQINGPHYHESFGQVNFFAGYRFLRRRADIAVGVLNLTDQDYRLDPLNVHEELPRERAFYGRLRLRF